MQKKVLKGKLQYRYQYLRRVWGLNLRTFLSWLLVINKSWLMDQQILKFPLTTCHYKRVSFEYHLVRKSILFKTNTYLGTSQSHIPPVINTSSHDFLKTEWEIVCWYVCSQQLKIYQDKINSHWNFPLKCERMCGGVYHTLTDVHLDVFWLTSLSFTQTEKPVNSLTDKKEKL